MTIVHIDDNSPQARQFLQYARTLPFARVERKRKAPKSTWQQAIDEGAVTVDEFFDEFDARIEKELSEEEESRLFAAAFPDGMPALLSDEEEIARAITVDEMLERTHRNIDRKWAERRL